MTTSGATRIDWLDGVKDACMVLVCRLPRRGLDLSEQLGETEWLDVSIALKPLRMNDAEHGMQGGRGSLSPKTPPAPRTLLALLYRRRGGLAPKS